jgi:hypothetical protein
MWFGYIGGTPIGTIEATSQDLSRLCTRHTPNPLVISIRVAHARAVGQFTITSRLYPPARYVALVAHHRAPNIGIGEQCCVAFQLDNNGSCLKNENARKPSRTSTHFELRPCRNDGNVRAQAV